MDAWHERCDKHQTRNCFICYPISKRGLASPVIEDVPAIELNMGSTLEPVLDVVKQVEVQDALVAAANEVSNAKAMVSIAQSTYDDAARAVQTAQIELDNATKRYVESKRALKELVNKEE